jgi:hypothetical protein
VPARPIDKDLLQHALLQHVAWATNTVIWPHKRKGAADVPKAKVCRIEATLPRASEEEVIRGISSVTGLGK